MSHIRVLYSYASCRTKDEIMNEDASLHCSLQFRNRFGKAKNIYLFDFLSFGKQILQGGARNVIPLVVHVTYFYFYKSI